MNPMHKCPYKCKRYGFVKIETDIKRDEIFRLNWDVLVERVFRTPQNINIGRTKDKAMILDYFLLDATRQ